MARNELTASSCALDIKTHAKIDQALKRLGGKHPNKRSGGFGAAGEAAGGDTPLSTGPMY
jgi:hypothetical protein